MILFLLIFSEANSVDFCHFSHTTETLDHFGDHCGARGRTTDMGRTQTPVFFSRTHGSLALVYRHLPSQLASALLALIILRSVSNHKTPRWSHKAPVAPTAPRGPESHQCIPTELQKNSNSLQRVHTGSRVPRVAVSQAPTQRLTTLTRARVSSAGLSTRQQKIK